MTKGTEIRLKEFPFLNIERMWPNNDLIMGNVRNHLLSIYCRTDVICDMRLEEERVTVLALELKSSR